MTTTTAEVTAAQEAEVLEILLTGGQEGFLTLVSRAAAHFANGHTPAELSDDAQEYVLKALEVYAQALNVARTSGMLMALDAPAEVINSVAAEGVPFIEEFDRLKAEFDVKWPEYAEPVWDRPIPGEVLSESDAEATANAAVDSDTQE